MQTIKNITFEIERLGNQTFCTISGNLGYILSKLNSPTVVPTTAGNSFNLKISPSREALIFAKNLKEWGFSLEYPTITVVAIVSLHEGDEDNQELADRFARDKAKSIMNAVVYNALALALKPDRIRLEQLDSIMDRLFDNSCKLSSYVKDVPESES